MFSPTPTEVKVSENIILDKKLVSLASLSLYKYNFGEKELYNFDAVLFISLFNNLIQKDRINIKDSIEAIGRIKNSYNNIRGKDYEIIVIKKQKFIMTFLVLQQGDFIPLEEYQLINKIKILDQIELLKEKLM